VKTLMRTLLTIVAALAAGRLEANSIGGFRLVAQTENFSFYTRDNRRPDVKRCQRFLADTAKELGQAVEGRSEYFLYSHTDEIASNTGRPNSGVTELASGRIHSVQEFHPHEIVHRVARLIGDPGPFFSEGLAVAMGNKGEWRGRPVDEMARPVSRERTLRSLVDDFTRIDTDKSYAAAGSFVTWLIRNHGGLPRLSDFLRACGKAGFPRDIRFREIYGFGLDEAGEAWAASLSSSVADAVSR
jgi:hypothetical protein